MCIRDRIYFDQVMNLWESSSPSEEVPHIDSPGPDYDNDDYPYPQLFNPNLAASLSLATDSDVSEADGRDQSNSVNELKEVLLEGEYEFTFNFQLPSDLPDTFYWNDRNKIMYLVTCVIYGPDGVRKKSEEIKVHKNLSSIENLRLICPNIYSKHSFTPTDKPITILIDIPNSVFELGQTEQLNLVISDKRAFKWVQVNIVQTLICQKDLFTYARERRYTIISSTWNSLTGEEGDDTPLVQSLHFFTIPSQDQLEPTITSKMIRNTYKLELRFLTKKLNESFLSRENKEDFCADFPITLVRPTEN
eukprot:TRINITY_DN525_c0_g2_i1.p1 TRINITY_DN525_c0_g2~~TRINITY_DN525_c0_g2_i1.p1  ORF type:complete len:305 (+),score=53.45 TRINITY_DN525_c0_g2_i1:34-948(+)